MGLVVLCGIERALSDTISETLTAYGYGVSEARRIAAARGKLARGWADLVLVDAPGPTEVLARSQYRAYPRVVGSEGPLVALVAWNIAEEEFHQLGYNAVIYGPFEVDTLISVMSGSAS